MMLANRDQATEEQLAKLPEFEKRYAQALEQWYKEWPNRPPPVYWDENKKDFYWLNRKFRRNQK